MTTSLHRLLGSLALLVGFGASASVAGKTAATTVWHVDTPERVGGLAAQVLGAPQAAEQAVVFDGEKDGLILPQNPLAGAVAFTIEVLIRPDEGGGTEQRFFHFEEAGGRGRRALLELRTDGAGHWWLDTFLKGDADKRTLIDPRCTHPTGRWHWVALRYDGKTMAHFVDGVEELAGPVEFPPMGAGPISLGVRQTRVSWFKGAIRAVRFTAEALPAGLLHREG